MSNSAQAFETLDQSPFHFIGSLVPTQHEDLLKIPLAQFAPLSGERFVGCLAYRTRKELAGGDSGVFVFVLRARQQFDADAQHLETRRRDVAGRSAQLDLVFRDVTLEPGRDQLAGAGVQAVQAAVVRPNQNAGAGRVGHAGIEQRFCAGRGICRDAGRAAHRAQDTLAQLDVSPKWLVGLETTSVGNSLGSLLVIFGQQIHPLWQSGWMLPVIYLMTAIMLGFAVVIFEATLSASGFNRPLETKVLTPLSRIMFWLLAAYVVVRVLDLVFRGALGTAFAATWQAFWFWIEMACFVVPLATLASESARRSASKLFVGAVLLMLGGFLLRINGFLVGYMTGDGWHYFPSFAELMVTVGLIAFEILAYIVIVRKFPVLPAAQPATR